MYAVGARFGLASSAAKRKCPTSEIQPAIVGVNGFSFDDGTFDGVRKVTVKRGMYGITYMRIHSVEDDHFQIREHRSNTNGQGEEVEFEVEYPKEYITAITISWNIISNDPCVMGIEFLTSYSRSQVLGTVDNSTKNCVEAEERTRSK